jgi:hypothetical protein
MWDFRCEIWDLRSGISPAGGGLRGWNLKCTQNLCAEKRGNFSPEIGQYFPRKILILNCFYCLFAALKNRKMIQITKRSNR